MVCHVSRVGREVPAALSGLARVGIPPRVPPFRLHPGLYSRRRFAAQGVRDLAGLECKAPYDFWLFSEESVSMNLRIHDTAMKTRFGRGVFREDIPARMPVRHARMRAPRQAGSTSWDLFSEEPFAARAGFDSLLLGEQTAGQSLPRVSLREACGKDTAGVGFLGGWLTVGGRWVPGSRWSVAGSFLWTSLELSVTVAGALSPGAT